MFGHILSGVLGPLLSTLLNSLRQMGLTSRFGACELGSTLLRLTGTATRAVLVAFGVGTLLPPVATECLDGAHFHFLYAIRRHEGDTEV